MTYPRHWYSGTYKFCFGFFSIHDVSTTLVFWAVLELERKSSVSEKSVCMDDDNDDDSESYEMECAGTENFGENKPETTTGATSNIFEGAFERRRRFAFEQFKKNQKGG
jgi:hypothetical protein